jgi:hypothetical protein
METIDYLYPSEIEAAMQAMNAKRLELSDQPLGRIYRELAIAALMAAAAARMKYIMLIRLTPTATRASVSSLGNTAL